MTATFLDVARASAGYDGESSPWANWPVRGMRYVGQIVQTRFAPNMLFGQNKADPDNPQMIVVEISLTEPVINPTNGQLHQLTMKKDGQTFAYPCQAGNKVTLTYKPKSQAMAAFVDALVAHPGSVEPLPGGMWADSFVDERPSDKGNPQKIHQVQYQPPSGQNMLAAATQAQAPVQQQYAAPPAQPIQQVFQPAQQGFAPAPAQVFQQPNQQFAPVGAPAGGFEQPAPFVQPGAPQQQFAPAQPVFANGAGNGHDMGFVQGAQPPAAPVQQPMQLQPMVAPSVATTGTPPWATAAAPAQAPQGFGPAPQG